MLRLSVSVDEIFSLSCELCGGDIPADRGISGGLPGTVECPHCFTVHVLECDVWADDDACDVHHDYYSYCVIK
jgi:hypothetical protein